jgi:phage baseplate assembly protein gpV
MGGFKPSRADIAGSTIVGSDKDVDVHQFSGSVFISGSLTLNGSSVSGGGGGGGAVANYTNSGDNRVITSVDSDTINGEADLTFNANSGHLGIGTANPNNPIEVIATASQQRWSYDTGVNNFATMAVSSDGDMTLSGSNYGTGTFAAGDIHIDASGRINLQADAGSFQFQRPGNTNRFTIDTSQGEVYLTNIQNTSTIFRGLTNQTTQLTIDPANTRVLLPTTHSVAFRDANTTIKSPDSNRLALTAPTLEVTGTLGLNGTNLTSTAAELNLLDAGATQHTASVLAAIPKLAKATYDFAEFGGGQSTFTLTGVTIPDNAMIVGGWVDTETNPASGGAATIAFGMTLGAVTDLFLGATAFDQFDSQAGGQLTAVNQATPAQYMKMAGSSTITCTIGGANLTAGKLHIYLQYVVGA